MPATLAQLEARVAALEAGATGAETNSPNYLTLTAAGLVGALFRGGVQLLEHSGGPLTAASELTWIDSVGFASETVLGSTAGPGVHSASLNSAALTGDNAGVFANCTESGAAGSAQVSASAGDSTGASGFVVLIDSLKRSSFLQLPSTKQLAMDCGTIGINFPNSTQSTDITIPHALGRQPSSVVFGVTTLGVNILVSPQCYNVNSASFALTAKASATVNGLVYVSWAVFG